MPATDRYGYMILIIEMSVGDTLVFSLVGPRPSAKSAPSNAYSMIDLGSKLVTDMPFGEYFSRTLLLMSAGLQKFGGPAKYFITAATSHLRLNFGDWCSWMQPSACPNSWVTTRWYSVSSVSSRSQP